VAVTWEAVMERIMWRRAAGGGEGFLGEGLCHDHG
jgi:hypothetical protein